MSDDLCQCQTCGRMHRRLGTPPISVMEQIARDMREGTFPRKSENTLHEESDAQQTQAKIDAAVSAERERCALIVERYSLPTIQTPSMWLVDKAGIAAEIRALDRSMQAIDE